MKYDEIKKYEDVIRLALLIRETELKLLELFANGKLFGTIHTCIGQEFVGISVARALSPEDMIVSNHRCHGHFIAYNQNVVGLIGEIMGRSIGVCGGRGGSQHLHQDNFLSNGVQGGIVPVALGLAYGQKLKNNNGIVVVFIGDGTLGQGVVYESMNIASKWALPILFVCENNFIAQSTSSDQSLAGNITARAEAFGIETANSNTWDWLDLLESIKDSIDSVRKAGKPIFHLVDTYRLMAHSKGDDTRPKDEVTSYWNRDPLSIIIKKFEGKQEFQAMRREVRQLVDQAVSDAEKSPFMAMACRTDADNNRKYLWKEVRFKKDRVVDSIRYALGKGLEEHENVLLIGEDIETPYGGAFKCTAGLSDKYPKRVRNTPISEAAIVGIGNGLAIAGFTPVVEIMFGDFLTLSADQWINHAGKFRWMYNNQVNVPLIIRTPMGGKRGYGPTHSQSLEKHFLGVPGTRVLCLHHRYCPSYLYNELFSSIDRPTLVIENKILYGRYVSSDVPAGYNLLCTDEPFPTVNLRPELSPDLTVIALGGISVDAEEAVYKLFEEEEIIVDLYLPTQLYPFDVRVLEYSLSQTGKLMVIEEGQGFVSLSSEIIAQVTEKFENLAVKCKRVTALENPIPSSRPLEKQCLPDTEIIIQRAKEFFGEFTN